MIVLHPQSPAGPFLIVLGLAGVTLSTAILRPQQIQALIARPREGFPTWRERLWVYLAVCGSWSTIFGVVVAIGPPNPAWDIRLPGEINWPVCAPSEYIYVLGYLTPPLVVWVPRTRGDLLVFAWRLFILTTASTILFLLVPIGAPPRTFESASWAGNLLRWETSRADFAAASFPSFHTLWAILLASACATRAGVIRITGWIWAVAMSVCCVMNGAHALLDVVASWILYLIVAAAPSPFSWQTWSRSPTNCTDSAENPACGQPDR